MTENVTKWAGRGIAVAQMGAGLGRDVVDVVERMQGSIARRPFLLGSIPQQQTGGIARMIYRCIEMGFDLGHDSLRHAAEFFPQDNDPNWAAKRAIMNGVFGDQLARRENRLAINMEIVTTGEPSSNSTLLLFIHGLCMSEAGWQDGSHPTQAAAIAKQLKADTAYLRYNSGLHISENGEQLASVLETHAEHYKRVVIIGHSMGGLLVRSAGHFAEQKSHKWPAKLKAAVMLGSPHNGAPMERWGNYLNTILTVSPYSSPLSRLGNLRSAGIHDLRHGNLLHTDWNSVADIMAFDDFRTPVQWHPKTAYLLVAATRSEVVPENVLKANNDLLVTVPSAWALEANGDDRLDSANITREIIAGIDHMDLIWKSSVYQLTADWLKKTL
jgi:pimeloyl-ACP methyl ester carboxylesterase